MDLISQPKRDRKRDNEGANNTGSPPRKAPRGDQSMEDLVMKALNSSGFLEGVPPDIRKVISESGNSLMGPVNRDEDYLCKSNESVELCFVKAPFTKSQQVYHPDFTYTFFGMDETIYGYKNLKIRLYYAAGSLSTFFDVKYDCKHNSLDEKFIPDIHEILGQHLQEDYEKSYSEFLEKAKEDEISFTPPGEKLKDHKNILGNNFEIYKANFNTPGFTEYHKRFELFFLFYIEGSIFIQRDHKWEGYVLYEKDSNNPKKYYAVGFCMTYPYMYYPDKIRMIISQFLILPQYRRKGLGEKFYKSLYNEFLVREDIREVNVEDQNDEFGMLRDKADCMMLIGKQINKENVFPSKEELNQLLIETKLTKKQAQTCLEILAFKYLDENDTENLRKLRLRIKERIFIQNYDQLSASEKDERFRVIDETYKRVKSYAKLIVNVLNKHHKNAQ